MKITKNLHIVLRNVGEGKKVYLLLGEKAIELAWMPEHPPRVKIAVALVLAFMLVFALFWLEPLLKLFAEFVCSVLNLK